jgi:hypothetical protein
MPIPSPVRNPILRIRGWSETTLEDRTGQLDGVDAKLVPSKQ